MNFVMKNKKEVEETIAQKIFKCYKCGFISDEKTKYCPQCVQEDLFILMQLFIEK